MQKIKDDHPALLESSEYLLERVKQSKAIIKQELDKISAEHSGEDSDTGNKFILKFSCSQDSASKPL